MQIVRYKSKTTSYEVESPLILESGAALQNLRIHYTTYGEVNKDKSNLVWVFHPLTANSDPFKWWPGVVGEDCIINPNEHFIVCANMIGSCYGSTEPLDYNFPFMTIKDMVKAHQLLRDYLGIGKVKVGIGGSMGGQQLLEWAIQEPDFFEIIIPLATNARHSAWGIAFNETQRMALKYGGEKGIDTARAIAMLSYRNYITYEKTQTDTDSRFDHFSASSYQEYQGEKLARRFSPYSYYYLSKAMDSHDVGRHFGGVQNALKRIESRAIVIGIDTDILFPVPEQELIADLIPLSSLYTIHSDYGHDGFLIEWGQIDTILKAELYGIK